MQQFQQPLFHHPQTQPQVQLQQQHHLHQLLQQRQFQQQLDDQQQQQQHQHQHYHYHQQQPQQQTVPTFAYVTPMSSPRPVGASSSCFPSLDGSPAGGLQRSANSTEVYLSGLSTGGTATVAAALPTSQTAVGWTTMASTGQYQPQPVFAGPFEGDPRALLTSTVTTSTLLPGPHKTSPYPHGSSSSSGGCGGGGDFVVTVSAQQQQQQQQQQHPLPPSFLDGTSSAGASRTVAAATPTTLGSAASASVVSASASGYLGSPTVSQAHAQAVVASSSPTSSPTGAQGLTMSQRLVCPTTRSPRHVTVLQSPGRSPKVWGSSRVGDFREDTGVYSTPPTTTCVSARGTPQARMHHFTTSSTAIPPLPGTPRSPELPPQRPGLGLQHPRVYSPRLDNGNDQHQLPRPQQQQQQQQQQRPRQQYRQQQQPLEPQPRPQPRQLQPQPQPQPQPQILRQLHQHQHHHQPQHQQQQQQQQIQQEQQQPQDQQKQQDQQRTQNQEQNKLEFITSPLAVTAVAATNLKDEAKLQSALEGVCKIQRNCRAMLYQNYPTAGLYA